LAAELGRVVPATFRVSPSLWLTICNLRVVDQRLGSKFLRLGSHLDPVPGGAQDNVLKSVMNGGSQNWIEIALLG
jgi:hypothetical protein